MHRLYSYKDIQKLEKFMQGKPLAEQEIGKLLLQETVSYAESSVCRRKTLLHYFGEEFPEENCGCCDNCVNPKPRFEDATTCGCCCACCRPSAISSRPTTWSTCWSVATTP